MASLEVIAERPVAEHLEEGEVRLSPTSSISPGGRTSAHRPTVARMLLPQEVRHERMHAGGGEQDRRSFSGIKEAEG